MDLAELARDDVADDAAEMVTKRSSADRGFDPLVAYLEGLDLKSSETIEANRTMASTIGASRTREDTLASRKRTELADQAFASSIQTRRVP